MNTLFRIFTFTTVLMFSFSLNLWGVVPTTPSKAEENTLRSISGIVSLPENVPAEWLDCVVVSVASIDSNYFGNAYVNSITGEYTVSGLDPSVYEVAFTVGPPQFPESADCSKVNLAMQWWQNTSKRTQASSVDLTNNDATGINAEMQIGRTISGVVNLPAGTPVEWMNCVEVYVNSVNVNSDLDSNYGNAEVDPLTGEYVVLGLLPEKYEVGFSVNKYKSPDCAQVQLAQQWWNNATTSVSASSVDLTASDAENINAQMQLGRTISGVVSLPLGAPVEWLSCVQVTAYFENKDHSGTASVDPDTGAYSITELRSGLYSVHFSVNTNWSSELSDCSQVNIFEQWWENSSTQSDATLLDVSSNDAININAQMKSGRTISGAVSLPAGAPSDWLECVSVNANSVGSISWSWGSSFVDPLTGRYSITGLEPGFYTLEFVVTNSADCSNVNLKEQWWQNTDNFTEATLVDLTNDHASNIDAQLQTGQTISGVVSLPDGVPADWLNCISVYVSSEDPYIYDSTQVNPVTGEYFVGGLPAAEYKVKFSAVSSGGLCAEINLVEQWWAGALTDSEATPVDVRLTDASNINAEMQSGRIISGKVLLPAGSPSEWLDCVVVEVTSLDNGKLETDFVDLTTGEYSLSGLAPGQYQIKFAISSYWKTEQVDCGEVNLASLWWPKSSSASASSPVDVTVSDASNINAQLQTGRIIRGTVSPGNSVPSSWLLCTIIIVYEKGTQNVVDVGYPSYSHPGYPDYRPEINGSFEIKNLPAGEFNIALEPVGQFVGSEIQNCGEAIFPTQWYNKASSQSKSETIDLRTSSIKTGVNISLGRYAFPQRWAGPDRIQTATAISKNVFTPGEVDTVVLATGYGFADALSATPLASKLGAPLLLTQQNVLSNATKAEILRLNPSKVIIVGGPPAVSNSVEAELKSMNGIQEVIRIGGADRYETSMKIAEFGWSSDDPSANAFIATGTNFPDALSAGAAAAGELMPVLLVPGANSKIPEQTLVRLKALGVSKVFIAGSSVAVSDGIENQLKQEQFTTVRFAGSDRLDTSVMIAAAFAIPGNPLYVSYGWNFPDALAGASAAGKQGASLVLSPGNCMSTKIKSILDDFAPENVVLLGGEPALSREVENYSFC